MLKRQTNTQLIYCKSMNYNLFSKHYLGLMLIHLTVVEISAVAFLAVQSAALLHVDGDDSHGYEDDHDDEAYEFAEEDGREQKAEEADADGGSGIGQEPATDTHEL